MTNTYKIADKIIEISSMYDDVHALCKDYLYSGTPDFCVSTSQEDIAEERKKSAEEHRYEGLPDYDYPDGYLETLAVYRKIADKMTEFDTLLFHGSVIAVDGVGYLFTAKSGTGKSTHTRLWRELFGERAITVNDDKPLIKIGAEGVTVYGTPWDGKHRLSTNTCVPLKAVCILTRGEKNHIEPISKSSAYAMLIQQSYRPKNPEKMAKTLTLLDRLAANVKLYRLSCNMEIEAAQVAYDGMK
jgi:hypothetical protein